MPDSWIDKKELEELVGSFAPNRKSRRKSLAPRSRDDEAPEATAPPATETTPVVSVKEIPAPKPEETDSKSDAVFLFEENPGGIGTADKPIADAVDHVGEANLSKDDEPEDAFRVAEAESSPWVTKVSATESLEPLDLIPEAPALPPAGSVDKHPPLPQQQLPEIRIESAGEANRDLPPFLDEPEGAPAPRLVSLSERDADRALIALAEARARAEHSHLLRVRAIPGESSAIFPEPEIDALAAILLPEPVPCEELETGSGAVSEIQTPAAELEPGPFGSPTDSTHAQMARLTTVSPDSTFVDPEMVSPPAAMAEPVPESVADLSGLFVGERLLRRVERFGEEARRRLDAREVIVCDPDGLILYSDVEEQAEGVLETALLLEVSAKANRLLGLASSRATQVSVGGGLWRCLLKQSGVGGDLHAGLLLPEPLEEGQIALWTRALSEVTGAPALNVT